jgi:hypothetical protein
MNIELKIKICSMASEAKIIRQMERHQKARARKTRERGREGWQENSDAALSVYEKIHRHRVYDVRKETRCSLLAYGFLRGKSYKSMEQTCKIKPNWDRVEQIATKFGGFKHVTEEKKSQFRQQFTEWMEVK